jgi:hypothetical protein
MALIYFDGAIFDSDKAIIKTIGAKHSIDDPIVQALFQTLLKLYLDNDKKISETLDIFKNIVENSERYKQIIDKILSSEEINKPRGIIPATPLFVKEESSNPYVIVEKLMAIEGGLESVKHNLLVLKEIGPGQKYAKEIEEIIKEIEELKSDVLSLTEEIWQPFTKRGVLSISNYLHKYATYVYKICERFGKIVNDINKIIDVSNLSNLKGSLKMAMDVIEETEQMILSTIIASDEICLSSLPHSNSDMILYDDLMALLLGMPMPHPVSYSRPGNGCSLVFDEVEISGGKIKLKLKGKIPGNANRVDVLRNVPFKHYEGS